jgi:hypothetical protein
VPLCEGATPKGNTDLREPARFGTVLRPFLRAPPASASDPVLTYGFVAVPTWCDRGKTRPRRSSWLVRPWPVGAGVHDVVRHFLNAEVWHLRSDSSAARRSAYYQGYAAAPQTAPTHELTCSVSWKWYRELQDQVGRCVAIYPVLSNRTVIV